MVQPGAGWRLPGGLRIVPDDYAGAVRAAVLAIAGVSLFVVMLDAVLFRGVLPADYIAHYTAPLWPRTGWACFGAALEEVKFRLLVMTALVALPGLIGRRTGPGWIVFAILAAQFANVGGLVLLAPFYATLRFWLVGAVWGWLYWRHGFVTALAGHSLCHLLLDPALRAALLG